MSKRRFFQMHLSTAVVLMLVAGVLIWANVREQYFPELGKNFNYFGWPFECRVDYAFYLSGASIPILSNTQWKTNETIYNALIALAILLAVWQVCEWRIRRKTRADTTS